RLEQRLVELHQIGVERQDHERQIGIDDTQIHREIGIEHGDLRQPERLQQIVDDAVVLEKADPRIDAQQKAAPERQDDQHQEDIAPAVGRASDEIGDRVADDQRDDGRDQRDLERAQERREVEAVLPQIHEVGEVQRELHVALVAEGEQRQIGRLADHAFAERNLDDDEQRDEEEDQQPQQRRRDHHPAAAHAGGAHEVADEAPGPPWNARRRGLHHVGGGFGHETSTEPALPLQLAHT